MTSPTSVAQASPMAIFFRGCAGAVLYSFTGTSDGAYPLAGLVRDAKGNLYGTTEQGGASGGGTVFEVDNTGKEMVLHSFNSEPDGLTPYAGLVRDAQGNLYGTTSAGGNLGYGTVFKLTPLMKRKTGR